MTRQQTFLTIIFSSILIACGQIDNSKKSDTAPYKLQDCLNKYQDFLVTAEELVTDSFYEARSFQNFETLKIDSLSSSTLYIKYRFKVKDTIADFFMTIGTMLSFEKTEDAAQKTLDIWEVGHNMGFKNSSAKDQQIQVNDLDSLLSFGVNSKFVEYRTDGHLRGYTITGRTKNIVFLHSVASNHIGHRDHVEILREKINVLTEFANKYE